MLLMILMQAIGCYVHTITINSITAEFVTTIDYKHTMTVGIGFSAEIVLQSTEMIYNISFVTASHK